MQVRLLHTADSHLDAPFRWLGGKGKDQRRQLKETFRGLVDLALQEQVDALLVAGDLFDSNSPSNDAIDLVRTQLARLPMPVILLPGTHDCLDETSIYRKVAFHTADGSDVHVFDKSHTAFEIGPALTVHGNANRTKTSPLSPLGDLRKNPGTRFNVALAHGSLVMPGTEVDFPMTPEEIGATGMDYLALGHWHSYRDCSAGPTRACYSGPPELLAAGEQGYALLVELTEAGTEVVQRSVGRRRYEKLSLPLDRVGGLEEIREQIKRKRDQDLVLTVSLTGMRPLSLVVDQEEMAQECAEGFFALKVEDSSHPMLSSDDIKALPENTVIGQFARLMKNAIGQATSTEEKRIREAALQLGLALLQGQRVLQ